jgi:hypothetical protein
MSGALPYIGAVVGGVIGFFAGGPVGAFEGAAVGYSLGSAVQASTSSTNIKLPSVTGPRLSDLRIQTSSYGKVIPSVYGQGRISGNVIWAQPIKEVQKDTTTTSTASGGKGGGSVTNSQTQTSFEYYATLAIAICEGPINGIIRVSADAKVLDDTFLDSSNGKYNVYLGTEDQLPDPIMESFEGAGNVPAYRGQAYVVIQDFPLAAFGNRIPNFIFEVKRIVRFEPAVEDKIKEIILIPGAGEFVYSPTVTTKQNGEYAGSEFLANGTKVPLNMHNFNNKADVLLALDQLQETFPNLETIALVVTWFATSTDAGACTIVPKVEFSGTGTEVLPDDWAVAGYNRNTAAQVLAFPDGKVTYGGTPSDKAIIDLCKEIKINRGLDIMFYPMIFVDTITPEPKPWRGRITPANATDANNWFTKTNGFNAFVRHYSQLSIGGDNLKDLISAFVLGSEFVGMTGYTNTAGNYPAVNQLVSLAALVKADLGSGVKLTYAADWSEYHHADGGWFNMDSLWASPNIDVVGIDSYFPLTPDLPQAQITQDKIKEGWEKDEGWDYFYDTARTTQTSFGGDATYAWKNVEHWWNNTHTNPGGGLTSWTSKMKPIWFTEYGFPSVDACANQPNVFYDPSSSESFYPRGSKGRVDFKAQREAINATLDFLQTRNQLPGNSGLIAKSFLWTWDARPFSFWPDLSNVWQDSILWKTGHWVNGKLGNSTLGAIIANLLERAGLTSTDYDVSRLTDTVDGYLLVQNITVRDAIEQLQAVYFFDMVESDGQLKFVKRGGESIVTIAGDDLVPLTKGGDIREILEIHRAQELDLPQEVNVTYINRVANYDPGLQRSTRQTTDAVDKVSLNVPIVMTDQEAKTIADVTLYNGWIQRVSYKFNTPAKYALIEPTDIVTIDVDGVQSQIRVKSTRSEYSGMMEIEGVAEDVASYDFYTSPGEHTTIEQPGQIVPGTRLELIDIPALPNDTAAVGILRVAVAPEGEGWRGTLVYRSDDGGETGGNTYNVLVGTSISETIGGAVTALALPSGMVNVFDIGNTVDIVLINGELSSVTELAVFNGANVAVLGNEIIQFQNATLLSEGKYRLSKILRGRLGTEHEAGTHVAGEIFVLLSSTINRVAMQSSLIGLSRFYKPVSVGGTPGTTTEESFTYTGKTLRPYSPVNIKGTRNLPVTNDWTITWVRRTRVGGSWQDGVDVPLNEESEKYHIQIMNGVTPVRTVETLTSPTFTYTAAMQVTDFGSVQSSLSVKIYQISAIVGRGVAGVGAF